MRILKFREKKISINVTKNMTIRLSVIQNCYLQSRQIKMLEYVLKNDKIVNKLCKWKISQFMPSRVSSWIITRRDDYVVEFIIANKEQVYGLIEVLELCQQVLTPAKTEFVLYFFGRQVRVQNIIRLYIYFWLLNSALYKYLDKLYLNTTIKLKIQKIIRQKNRLNPTVRKRFIISKILVSEEEYKNFKPHKETTTAPTTNRPYPIRRNRHILTLLKYFR